MSGRTTFNGLEIPVNEPLEILLKNAFAPLKKEEQSKAICALGGRVEREAAEALLKLMNDRDWTVRRFALENLGYHSLAPHFLPQIRILLTDESPYVVQTACEVLARLKDETSHRNIQDLLHNNDEHTRDAALRAISSIWLEDDFEIVMSIYHNDPSLEVRKQAA